jgi:hypothetical protein
MLPDLWVKPCSRGYQDAGGRHEPRQTRHEQLILAKRQENEVALVLQPQRAAFRDSSVPLW